MAIAQAFLDSHIQTHLVRLCSHLHGPETTSLHAPSPSLIRPAPGMTSAGAQLFMVFGKKVHALSNPAFVHLVYETIEASQGSRMDGIRSLLWNRHQITQYRTFECSYTRISPMIDLNGLASIMFTHKKQMFTMFLLLLWRTGTSCNINHAIIRLQEHKGNFLEYMWVSTKTNPGSISRWFMFWPWAVCLIDLCLSQLHQSQNSYSNKPITSCLPIIKYIY